MRKWVLFLLLVLISISFASAYNTKIVFNNTHPMPGETISFNGSACIYRSNFGTYNRVIIEEPSGRFVVNPDYVNITIDKVGNCGSNYVHKYNFNGTIKVGKNFVDGEYNLILAYTRSLSDYFIKAPFIVGNYTPGWKYSFYYKSNWYKEDFDDSNWRTGYMPFGNSRFFKINTSWRGDNLYLRKDVYLDDIQANLKLYFEGRGKCFVNGVEVFSGDSINGEDVGYCYRGKINVYYDGGRVSSVRDNYYSSNIFYVDVSKYLHPGKNVIACSFAKIDDIYYTCWGTGCHHRRYYPSRNYVDVHFAPLHKNSVFWYEHQFDRWDRYNWYKPTFPVKNTIRLYDCEDTHYSHGTTPRFVRVNNLNYGSWKWSELDVTDDTTFYHKPNHFNWNMYYNHRRIYWGYSPFNGKTTYFRKWIWSDKDKYVMFKISATREPTCYLNGKNIVLQNYNSDYWNYYSPINLRKGANLIACRQYPSDFSLFDMENSGFDGKLKISSITATNTEGGVNLTVTLENVAHPEVDSSVEVEANNKTYSKEISSANVSKKDTIGVVNFAYNSGWFRNIKWVSYTNTSDGRRASDGDWNTYARIRNRRSSMKIEKKYQFPSNTSLDKLQFKYKFSGVAEVYFFNYKTDQYDKVDSYHTKNPVIRVVNVANATDYVSQDDKIRFKIFMSKMLHNCYQNGYYFYTCYYNDVRYYDDEIYAEGIRNVYTNFTKINSQVKVNLFVPLGVGSYNLTISAIDLIDGDIDIFPTELNVSNVADMTTKVGFLPFGGNAEEGNSTSSGGSSTMLILATTTIASASAVVVLSRGRSTPLRRLETSLSRAEKIVARLQGYRDYSIRKNFSSYMRMLNEKFTIFKQHMKERQAEEERVKMIKEYLKFLKKQAMLKAKLYAQKETRELLESLSGSLENQIRQIDDFFFNHQDLPYELDKYLLKYRRSLFARIFGISSGSVDKLVKKFAKENGLTGYIHLGRYADKLRLIIDDPKLREKFKEFLGKENPSSLEIPDEIGDIDTYSDIDENTGKPIGEFIKDGLTGIWNGVVRYTLKLKNIALKIVDWIKHHPFKALLIAGVAIVVIIAIVLTGGLALALGAAAGLVDAEIITVAGVTISVGTILEIAAAAGLLSSATKTFFACGENPNSEECGASGEATGGWIISYVGGELVFRIGGLVFKGAKYFTLANNLKETGYADEEIAELLKVASKYGKDGEQIVGKYGKFGAEILSRYKNANEALKFLKVFDELDDETKAALEEIKLSEVSDDFFKLFDEFGDSKALLKYLSKADDVTDAAKQLGKIWSKLDDAGKAAFKKAIDKVDINSLTKLARANIDEIGDVIKSISKLNVDVSINMDGELPFYYYFKTIKRSLKTMEQSEDIVFNKLGGSKNDLKHLVFGPTYIKDVPGTYNSATKTVTLDVSKLVYAGDDEIDFVIIHESIHSVAEKYKYMVLERIGFEHAGDWVENEAHDLIVWQLLKKADPATAERLEHVYLNAVSTREPVQEIVEFSKLDKITPEDINYLTSKLPMDEYQGFIAEWLVVDPKNAKTIIANLKLKISNATLLKKIKEIEKLAKKYTDLIKVI